MKTRYYSRVESPVGPLLLLGDGESLTGMYMNRQRHGPEGPQDAKRDDDLFSQVRDQLKAYFAGELHKFDLRLEPEGTSFQKTVWKGLLEIPYGVTESYGELAKRIGHDLGARAVGLANGRNPIGIIIPCHRVIGANGTLTGYGGGLERKQWLLEHEQSHSKPRKPMQAQLSW
ncbi:MAG TPA: methylated-DNA--[protein]-cysteine S-methyltransferase [Steroidobacteraceae bacterium]|nr:methylated-DNA--[protein]-cysteine S-methyltransferase [Steroidobacteraceae bacterium]